MPYPTRGSTVSRGRGPRRVRRQDRRLEPPVRAASRRAVCRRLRAACDGGRHRRTSYPECSAPCPCRLHSERSS